MSASFFNSGLSGLRVAQLGLLTTGHNISNASTPGFNRQSAIQTANQPTATASGFVGQGVQVSTIARQYSSILSGQVNQAQTAMSGLESYSAQITQIDNMLADPTVGLSPALQGFFNGVQDVSANPSQLPARQSMISSAQTLASRYQTIGTQLGQLNNGVNQEITSAVASVNTYAQQIGDLNQQIVIAQAGVNQPANDLLDQRDQLVSQLNKLINVTTTTDSNGSFNVFIGSGQQLVVGAQVSGMAAVASSADPTKVTVGMQTGGGGVQELPESLITGGSISGLLKFRSDSLDKTSSELGRNAASLALTFNAQNALGEDLLGQTTGVGTFQDNFFNISSPTVTANTKNPVGSPTVTASFTPPSANGNFYTELTGSNYQLSAAGGAVTLTRISDNKQWSGASVDDINTALATDPQGFTLAPAGVALSDGARYLIKPTSDAANNLSVNTTVAADARLVAAAAPVRTQASTANTGTASMSAGSVATGYPSAVAGAPITLTYDATSVPPSLTGFPAGLTVSVSSGGTSTDYTGSIPYTSGATITLQGDSPPGGFSFSIAGSPNNGDHFSILKNAAGVSDGRNALALGQLQTQNTMTGKTASFQSTYAQLVNDIGNKASQAKVMGDAQQSLLTQTQSARDSLSGVNLDEEATNLIRYQQAYQAAAKVIEIGSKLFDSLLAM